MDSAPRDAFWAAQLDGDREVVATMRGLS